MKTEPTEALKEIKHCTWTAEDFNTSGLLESYEVVDEDDAVNIANIAFKEGQSSPKIKQLEWEELSREVIEADYEYPPESVFKAATPFMYYTIHKSFTNTFEVNGDPEIYSSIKEAKAASQAAFEKRVMECLE